MRAISFILVFTIFSSLVNAQEIEKVTFGFGVGINIAAVSLHSPSGSVSPNSMVGFRACESINAPLGKNFSLQPELAFDWMGWRYEDNNSGGQQANIEINLPYLTLAVLPKYQFKNSGFAVYAGPSYGLLLAG